MDQPKSENMPTILVIFGATGDLMAKKIVPALFHLYKKQKLPGLFHIIGFSRRPMADADFKKKVAEIIKKHKDISVSSQELEKFTRYVSYHQGDFTSGSDYENLAKKLGRIDGEWKTCANKLFYLAVPPQYYESIFNQLALSGLTIPCGPDGGWTRVLVEKPFGNDAATAEKLDLLLGRLFKEEQIYRIDHYLAKEMLQNILTFRFSNNLLESSWNNRFIEKIEIKLYETIGVEGRGAFYDGLGALRDVGQNHLLQMLALVTMERTHIFDPDMVRRRRADILKRIDILSKEEVKRNTIRGQYEGYQDIQGVEKKSDTETYFRIKCTIDDPRWKGIPIILESGKSLPKPYKEIIVTFKHLDPCLCPDDNHKQRNRVVFSLEPREKITIDFWSKRPGLDLEIEERTFEFQLRKNRKNKQYVEEYEKLLMDCFIGNQLLFVSTDEVKAMWRFTDPIVEAWKKNATPLQIYKPNKWNILKMPLQGGETVEADGLTKKEIALVGLGKMGANVARRLLERGWRVYGYNRTADDTKLLEKEGLIGRYSLTELVRSLKKPRIVWFMLPAGSVFDELVFGANGIVSELNKGDIVIDAANSFYKDSIERGKKFKKYGINYVDIGFSGGPGGARNGASLMIGGERKNYEYLIPLFADLSVAEGFKFFDGAGAGHFVKMVHNGIEYGMMQAIAEGFAVLRKSKYKLDLTRVAEIYNHGSVIESKLVGWLENAFEIYGSDLKDISGKVAHTGEGKWTVETAEELEVKTTVIKDALQFRIDSEKDPSYTGKVLSALRNQFGGHKAK